MGNHPKNPDKSNNSASTKPLAKAEIELNIKRFNKINVVGKGGFGKVFFW